jgi:hypothetical protein
METGMTLAASDAAVPVITHHDMMLPFTYREPELKLPCPEYRP